ncbi:HTH CENPB-type domain-containing protein [Nephila pilipes]|uniref:HTH CENPB-type domain-containing protein n=1 Tax=Nephila pilipes TaxID=299642 RepID=A0A8X6QLN1_NEPPI|nr:HTH CENPB-type domain-containing protein [Nephila pilipes]
MDRKKCSKNTKRKKEWNRATIEVKKDLIAKHESRTRLTDLAFMFEMPKPTVCTILKNKEAIKAADVSKGVTTLSARRWKSIEELEKFLYTRINEKLLAGDEIS